MPDAESELKRSPFAAGGNGASPAPCAWQPLVSSGDDNGRVGDCTRWFIRMRWVATAGVAVSVWIADRTLHLVTSPLPLYAMALAMAVFNAGIQYRCRRDFDPAPGAARRRLHVQIGADLVFLTGLIHLSGGIENPFSFFYVFLIVISGILLGRRASYTVATCSIALFSGMTVMEQTGALPHHHLFLGGEPHAVTAGGTSLARGPYRPLQITVAVSAFSLTALVLCHLVDLVFGALRASILRERGDNAMRRAVLDSMREGVVFFDETGRIVSCNPAARDLHGCTQHVIGQGCTCCQLTVDSHQVRQIVQDILEGRQARSTLENVRGDRIILNTFGPVGGPEGKPIGVIWVLVDLTAMRRLQMEVLQHERSAVLAELTSFVAHDIGNVLDGTLNGLRIVEASASKPEECARWAREVRTRVEQVPPLIRGLVTLSRRKQLQREPVSLREVAERAVHMVSFRAQQHAIRCEIMGDVAGRIEGDGVYLMLAIVNLLLNAFDAVDAGGRVRVELRAAPQGPRRAEIACIDNGCGIPPESLDRIFDPFYTTKAESGGTGLGLTIARRIAEEHGGTLQVSSVSGAGSTFVLSLPLEEERL